MTTLYLIRHAEAEGNLYRRIHGWYDALITDNGYRQIKALEGRFSEVPVDAVYSSDLFRTKTTARAVYEPKGLELRTAPGLREVHMGDWEDHPWGRFGRRMGSGSPSSTAATPPGGPPTGRAWDRWGSAWSGPSGPSPKSTRIRRWPCSATAPPSGSFWPGCGG